MIARRHSGSTSSERVSAERSSEWCVVMYGKLISVPQSWRRDLKVKWTLQRE